MNAETKKEFINTLCDLIRNDLLAAVSKMPESWDGIELRQLIADKYAEVTGNMSVGRKRAYKNEVITRNL